MTHQNTALYQAMITAVSQSLENMVFAETLEQSEEFPLDMPETACWVSLLIHDPVQGEVRLAMPENLLKQFTSTIFSLDEDEIEEAQMNDILSELLNTIAGVFMTNLLADDETFQLGLPEHGDGPLPAAEENAISWNLQIEESPMLVTVSGAGLVSKNT